MSKWFLEESFWVPWTQALSARAPLLSGCPLTPVLLHKPYQWCHRALELIRREILAVNWQIWCLFPKLHCFFQNLWVCHKHESSYFRDHSRTIYWIRTSPLSPLPLLSCPFPAQIRMSPSFFWLKTEISMEICYPWITNYANKLLVGSGIAMPEIYESQVQPLHTLFHNDRRILLLSTFPPHEDPVGAPCTAQISVTGQVSGLFQSPHVSFLLYSDFWL